MALNIGLKFRFGTPTVSGSGWRISPTTQHARTAGFEDVTSTHNLAVHACDTILHIMPRDNSETSLQLRQLLQDTNYSKMLISRSKFGRVSLALNSVVQCPL